MDYSRDLRPAKWGSGITLHSNNLVPPMSALGQKRTFRNVRAMSALPPKADMDQHRCDVCFVPKAAPPKADIAERGRHPRCAISGHYAVQLSSTHEQLTGDLTSHCHDLIFAKPGPHQIGDE